ncbi:cupin domain-containing protein [Oceanobacillus sp. CAU 1775]
MYDRYFPYYHSLNYYPQTHYPVNRYPSNIVDPSEDHRQKDFGKHPYVVNMEQVAEKNKAFRRALWTGEHLQVTLMSIDPGEAIGLENHRTTDQFLSIVDGRGLIQMGNHPDRLNIRRSVKEDDVVMIPAGTWHNLSNTGRVALKLYSIYAPPEHPHGSVAYNK